MTTLDCVIIADGSPSPAARRQLVRLLDAHQGAGVRTGLVILRGDRTALGWLDAPDIVGIFPEFDPNLLWSATAIAREEAQVLKFSWQNYVFLLKMRLDQEAYGQFMQAVAASANLHLAH